MTLAIAPATAATSVTLPQAPSCPVFPQTNVWNKPVDALPLRENSTELMESIGLDSHLHPDFSSISEGWTSADAAGLPILAGLARYDEVAAGEIRQALRFTAEVARRAYI
jgi:hypothetical protein